VGSGSALAENGPDFTWSCVRRPRLRPKHSGSVGFNKAVVPSRKSFQTLSFLEKTMWTKPEFTEMRFGFEVTMYIANR
jgi:coenzyme PQQ precursor peptide PqqA